MGGSTQEKNWYGSPVGGETMYYGSPVPRSVIPSGMSMPDFRDRPESKDVNPNDEIYMQFYQRVINDILKNKIDLDALKRLPEMKPSGDAVNYFPNWNVG